MTGKRKLFMFFSQLAVVGILTGIGKMTGAEFVSLETFIIPSFILGNYGEHRERAKNANTPVS